MNVNRLYGSLTSSPRIIDSPRLSDPELSSIANTVARRNLYAMTISNEGFLQKESQGLLILNKLASTVDRMQIYRRGQIADIMEGPEINAEWEKLVRSSSGEFLTDLYELKNGFPYIYNNVAKNLYRELEKSPVCINSQELSSDEIEMVLGDVEGEASEKNITDKSEIAEMKSESFLLKMAETHITNRLKDGNLNFCSIVKVLRSEIKLQRDYSLDAVDSELNAPFEGIALARPISRANNSSFSLTSLWQRVTGSTPATATTAASSRSSSCKVSPINF